MGQQPPPAALTGQLAHFNSKTVLAEKLKTDKLCSTELWGKTNKQTPSYQRCPSSCPRNCGCSSYISPSWEGLTDHFWRHSQMGRKAQMPKSVLFSSIPKYSDEVNEKKSSFIFCVPLEHNGCSSLMLFHTFTMPIPNLIYYSKTYWRQRITFCWSESCRPGPDCFPYLLQVPVYPILFEERRQKASMFSLFFQLTPIE